MRRWVWKLVLVCGGLVALAALAVQVALWSDLPRRTVLRELRQRSGLQIDAAAVRTGWFGGTTLKDVTVALPLSDAPMARMPTLHVSHTSVPAILLGRGVRVLSAELVEPDFTFRQDQSGSWNIARAIERIREASPPRDGAGSLQLPELALRDASIRVSAHGGDEQVFEGVEFRGQPDGALTWRFELDVPEVAAARGSVISGGNWLHEVSFEATAPPALVKAFQAEAPSPLEAAGSWRGELADGAIRGRIELRSASAGEAEIEGDAALAVAGGRTLSIDDPNLTIASPQIPGERVRVESGEIRYANESWTFHGVQIELMDATALVSGNWNENAGTAELDARWVGQVPSPDVRHGGSLSAQLRAGDPGAMLLDAQIRSSGAAPAGEWEAHIIASARGRTWKNLVAQLEATTLRWSGEPAPIDLDGATATLSTDWPVVRLSSAALPRASASGDGQLNAHSREWSLNLSAADWTLASLMPNQPDGSLSEPIDVRLRAAGEAQRVERAELSIKSQLVQVDASGDYLPERSPPVVASATVHATLPARSDAPAAHAQAQFQHAGSLHAAIDLQGRLDPLSITYSAQATARNVPAAADCTIESIRAPFTGTLESTRATFDARQVSALGGTIDAAGTYRFDGAMLEMNAAVQQLALDQLAALLDVPVELNGTLTADAKIELPVEHAEQVKIDGQWQVAGGLFGRQGDIRGQGRIHAAGGMIMLNDVRLQREHALLEGSARYTLDQRALSLDVTASDWPLRPGGAQIDLLVNGSVDLELEYDRRAGFGTVDLTADALWRGQQLGPIKLQGTLHERMILASSIGGQLLGGSISGSATVPLDDFMHTRGALTLQDADLAALSALWPAAGRFDGLASGTLTIAPTDDPRALEPTRIDLAIRAPEARYGALELGDAHLVGFAGPHRIIIDDSQFAAAGGTVKLWARLSRHGDEPFAHIDADLRNLSIDQIVHAANPHSGPVPGLLNGRASVGGYLRQPHRTFGDARLELSRSDLVNIPFMSVLYSILNLKLVPDDQPQGHGTAVVRLEGDALQVSRLDYFNRGADVLARLAIQDLWRGGQSPLSGVAAGAVRPLKDIELPFFDELDRALKALQSDAATVRINGTLAEPQTRVVPFAEISGALRRILTGAAE